MKLKNPFLTRGYAGSDYFCDRESETRKLLDAFDNDRDITLISPRRYGKTGLIHHAFSRLPSEFTGIYLDIYSTRSLADFSSLFASSVIGALDSRIDSAVSAVGRFFKACRPTVVPQEDGMPKFSFDVVPSNAEATIKEAFEYLKSKDKRAVIAIDEFQQIAEYPEKGVEALLRGQIQLLPGVRFVFAGSHKHMMEEMFVSPNRPFYQSTQILSLHTIPCNSYSAFARRFFDGARLPFDSAVFEEVYRRFDGITWYVQAVMNRIWGAGDGLSNVAQVDAAVKSLVEDQSDVYHDLIRSQSEGSRKMLRAIARAGAVRQPSAGKFVASAGFKAASSEAFALKDLRGRDLVYETDSGWVVYDRLFGVWLREN